MSEANKKVKVKFLKNVGPWVMSQVVEFSEAYAKQICKPSEVWEGEKLVPHVRAMFLEEVEKLEKAVVSDPSKLTQTQLEQLGGKNIVVTPKDPVFEAKLAQLRADDAKIGEEAKAKSKGKGKAKKEEEPPQEEPPKEA